MNDSTYTGIRHLKPREHISKGKDSNFSLPHSQFWSKPYLCTGSCPRKLNKANKEPSDENSFSVWVAFKAVPRKWKVCLPPAFQGPNKCLTASSYITKILQVLLQIFKQPEVLNDTLLFFLPQVSGSFSSGTSLEVVNLSQAHTFTPEHKWEVLRLADTIFKWEVLLSIQHHHHSRSEFSCDLLTDNPYSLMIDTERILVDPNLRINYRIWFWIPDGCFVGNIQVIPNTW